MGGEPHVLVGKRQIIAHLHQDHACDRVELGGKSGLLLEALHLAHRHVDRESTWPDWIAATRADGSLMIWMVTRAILAFGPQSIVAFEHDAGVQLVFGEPVGPGADGFLRKLSRLSDSMYFFGTI